MRWPQRLRYFLPALLGWYKPHLNAFGQGAGVHRAADGARWPLRRYVQLVESYRDDAGRVKKRTVATLGRLDQISGELDSVIDGRLKVAGREPVIAQGVAASAAAAPS